MDAFVRGVNQKLGPQPQPLTTFVRPEDSDDAMKLHTMYETADGVSMKPDKILKADLNTKVMWLAFALRRV